jgi:hypothetical protein
MARRPASWSHTAGRPKALGHRVAHLCGDFPDSLVQIAELRSAAASGPSITPLVLFR